MMMLGQYQPHPLATTRSHSSVYFLRSEDETVHQLSGRGCNCAINGERTNHVSRNLGSHKARMMETEEYMRDHVWLPILIGIVGILLLLLLLIALCGCRYYYRRKGSFYVNLQTSPIVESGEDAVSYSSLEMKTEEKVVEPPPPRESIQAEGGEGKEIGLFEAMEKQRRYQQTTERESAVLACQFHIRNNHRYTVLQTLPDMGSRMQKYWFLVSPNTTVQSGTQLLLTMAPVSKQCPIRLHGTSLRTLNELLAALKHPYLQPLTEVDYITEKSSVIVIQPFVSRGSLKDMIYKSQPCSDWSAKYSTCKKGLPLETIALFGRQILEALVLLYRKGFPLIGHIQTGNVLVKDGTCRLSGYDNTLLGYKTRLYRVLKDDQDSIDVIMFGHLLFEMGCGYELVGLWPEKWDYQAVRYQPLLEVLQFIFSNESGNFPTVHEVLELSFFQRVRLPEPHREASEQLHFSVEIKALLRAVRKGKPVETQTKAKRRTSRQASEDSSIPRYPVTALRSSVSMTTSQASGGEVPSNPPVRFAPSPTAKRPLAPPPTAKKPVAFPPPAPRRTASNRGALLGDIKRGKNLKKTVTNDRSAPRLTF